MKTRQIEILKTVTKVEITRGDLIKWVVEKGFNIPGQFGQVRVLHQMDGKATGEDDKVCIVLEWETEFRPKEIGRHE